jgi:hypothetical protein
VANQAEQRQTGRFDGAQLELLGGEPAAFPQQGLAVEVQPCIGKGPLVAGRLGKRPEYPGDLWRRPRHPDIMPATGNE